jgi:hypothetical protein
MSKTAIKCSCGQRIGQKDVMQTGYYMRMFGPSFVYVKFRCSRCKKLGEQFVKQEDWEGGILKDSPIETSSTEKERFKALGPIDMRELVDFHYALESLNDLSALNAEFKRSAPDEAGEKNEK